MTSSRQLAAIMFTDIVGYTALMQASEMIARGSIDLKPILSATFPFDQLTDAFEASTDLENYRVVVTM